MPKTFMRLFAVLAIAGLLGSLGAGPVAAGSAAHATRASFVVMTGEEEATATCAPPTVCGDRNAIGAGILIVNQNTDRVCFLMAWRKINGTVIMAHIHDGPPGVAGPIVVPLFMDAAFSGRRDHAIGCVPGSGWTDDINANPSAFYVNVHSTVFPAGAIRDQLP